MRSWLRGNDLGFKLGTGFFAAFLVVIVLGIGFELWRQSMLTIEKFGFGFWLGEVWDPVSGEFGARPFIWGTLYSSVLALLLAGPIALGIAIYLSELCPARLRTPLTFLTELLAAIPSIVYGLWGIFVLVPVVRSLEQSFPAFLRGTPLFSGPAVGVGMLAAVLILAIMVIPFASSVAREVLKAVPELAARGGLCARGDPLGSDPCGALLRPDGDHRLAHPRLRPRPGRDDGGDDGHRQQPADHGVAVRSRSTRCRRCWPTSSPRPPTTSISAR